MKGLNFCALILMSVMLLACTKTVTVNAPVISPMDFASQSKTSGHYAVMVQAGAWHTEVKAAGFACSAWSFPTDFETAYNQSIKASMQQNFENVSFVEAPLSPAALKEQNFDAQIVVYEGSILTNFSVAPNFWTVTINANVGMDGIVAVIDPTGKVSQGNVRGSGTGAVTVMGGCTPAGEAITNAGRTAIRDYVLNAVNSAKLNVLQVKVDRSVVDGKPTS
jgi:hypothetical protein